MSAAKDLGVVQGRGAEDLRCDHEDGCCRAHVGLACDAPRNTTGALDAQIQKRTLDAITARLAAARVRASVTSNGDHTYSLTLAAIGDAELDHITSIVTNR